MFKRTISFSAFLLITSLGVAQADIDPLYGFCSSTSPATSSTCASNGTVTPLSSGPSGYFGFYVDPQSGTLLIDILIPDNYSLPASFSITGNAGSGNGGGALSATASEVSGTPWTSGNLDAYLGQTAPNVDPISDWLPSTKAYDPGATGYYVFQANLGTLNLYAEANIHDGPIFNDFSLPEGSIIAAYLEETSSTIGTDPTGALFVTPEPSSIVLLASVLLVLSSLIRKEVQGRS
jgi:hypothetical protein